MPPLEFGISRNLPGRIPNSSWNIPGYTPRIPERPQDVQKGNPRLPDTPRIPEGPQNVQKRNPGFPDTPPVSPRQTETRANPIPPAEQNHHRLPVGDLPKADSESPVVRIETGNDTGQPSISEGQATLFDRTVQARDSQHDVTKPVTLAESEKPSSPPPTAEVVNTTAEVTKPVTLAASKKPTSPPPTAEVMNTTAEVTKPVTLAASGEPATTSSPILAVEVVRAPALAVGTDTYGPASPTDVPSIAVQNSIGMSEAGKPNAETPFTLHEATSFKELIGEELPPRSEIGPGREIYQKLFEAPVHVFSRPTPEGMKYIMVGQELDVRAIAACLGFPAIAYKGFADFDLPDILGDRDNLFHNPKHAERKKRHEALLGWDQYVKGTDLMYRVLNLGYDRSSTTTTGTFVDYPWNVINPVVSWEEREGQRTIDLNPLDDRLRAELAQKLGIQNPEQLSTGIGPAWLASYSPNETKWAYRIPYTEKIQQQYPEGTKEYKLANATQVVGPGQILAYLYSRLAQAQQNPGTVPPDQDLQRSPILQYIEEHAADQELLEAERPLHLRGTNGIKTKVLHYFAGVDLSKTGVQMIGDNRVLTNITHRGYDSPKVTHKFLDPNRNLLATYSYQDMDGEKFLEDYVLRSIQPDQSEISLSLKVHPRYPGHQDEFMLDITYPNEGRILVTSIRTLTDYQRQLILDTFGISIRM